MTSEKERLENNRLDRAAAKWCTGMDTWTIAQELKVPEAWVLDRLETIKLRALQRERTFAPS